MRGIFELPKCFCGRELHPFADGRFVVGLFGAGCVMLCHWCDTPVTGFTWDDEQMWAELEMLERGFWPRRIQGLTDGHQPHPNCRCVLPQVDPPDNPV